jgi:hypothetical protein
MNDRAIGIRWTIGDVSAEGFEALRLAAWGAWGVFGPGAEYAICVNTVPVDEARRLTGPVPGAVRWLEASGRLPDWVLPHVDGAAMVEGKAWKFDPFQLFRDRWEISFDNDVILWEMPASIRTWLAEAHPERCLIAEDVRASHGAFARWAGAEPRNSGIRGIPPWLDLAEEARAVLHANPVVMRSELDEQGLQVAAVSRRTPPAVVSVDEVSICSPFPPHLSSPGRAGAHFVGLNERHLPWDFYGRPAVECIREHWSRMRPLLYERVGIEPVRSTESIAT